MQKSSDLAAIQRRTSNALPVFGPGELPEDKFATVKEDTSGFIDVLKLFLRSWPYIRPQFLGKWHYPGVGTENRVADAVAGDGFSFWYAPILVALVGAAGPLLGIVPRSIAYPLDLFYLTVLALVIATAVMVGTSGKRQLWATVAAVFCGFMLNIFAMLLVEGWNDGFYAVAVTVAAVFGWAVQYRRQDGRFSFRIRVSTHLCYLYAIEFFQRAVAFFFGLFLVDLLNQSLLQAEPLAPGLSNMLGLPDLSSESIASLTSDQRYQLLFFYIQISVIRTLFDSCLGVFTSYYRTWILQRINQDLRVALVERWHQLSLNYHSEHRTGDSIFRVYQDSAMVTNVIGHLISVTMTLLNYFTAVFLVSLLSPLIGMLAALLVIPAFVWANIAMPRVRVRSLAYRAATSDVTSNIQEALGSIKLIKAFNAAERVQKKFEHDSIIAFNAAYRVRNLIALVTIVMFTVATSFMILGESLMAWWAYQQRPTFMVDLIALVGVSFVVWNYGAFGWAQGQFRSSANNLRKLLRDWMTAQDMAMGLRRVFDILDIEPDVQDREDAVPIETFEEEIKFDNVSFRYEPDRPVLNQVSFSVAPGTITAIIGPTGSGKSTLMALLLRLFDPEEGSISIDNRDIREYQTASLRKSIAIALQENLLFGMSIRDNIRYVAPDATEDELENALKVAAIDSYVKDLPEGLDTVLSDRGGKLSTGQRQRLSIARAIIRRAPILVLDEPTAALDAATEHLVMKNLTDWVRQDSETQQRAIFLITHRISTIRQADSILYLDNGTIIERGNHDELMNLDEGRYRAFVEAESNLTNTLRRPA